MHRFRTPLLLTTATLCAGTVSFLLILAALTLLHYWTTLLSQTSIFSTLRWVGLLRMG